MQANTPPLTIIFTDGFTVQLRETDVAAAFQSSGGSPILVQVPARGILPAKEGYLTAEQWERQAESIGHGFGIRMFPLNALVQQSATASTPLASVATPAPLIFRRADFPTEAQRIETSDVWAYSQLLLDAGAYLSAPSPSSTARLYHQYAHILESPRTRYGTWIFFAERLLCPAIVNETFLVGAVEQLPPALTQWLALEKAILTATLVAMTASQRLTLLKQILEAYPHAGTLRDKWVVFTLPMGLEFQAPFDRKRLWEKYLVDAGVSLLVKEMQQVFLTVILGRYQPVEQGEEERRWRSTHGTVLLPATREPWTAITNYLAQHPEAYKGPLVSQHAVDAAARAKAERDEQLASGQWLIPADPAERRQRLQSIPLPEIEDLFHNTPEKLPACMRQVVKHARQDRDLKNDERRAMARWLVALSPQHPDAARLFGITPLRDDAQRAFDSDVKNALKVQNAPRFLSFGSCYTIQNERAREKEESCLTCPYMNDATGLGQPGNKCASELGVDGGWISDPTDAILFAVRR